MSTVHILVVDNDPDFVALCAEYLQGKGYRVLRAHSPAEARAVLAGRRCHLVILDMRLINDADQKDKSGLTLAKEIAASIPKLILTRYPTHQDVREALRPDAGGRSHAVDFVDKRMGLDELLAAVEKAVLDHVQIDYSLAIRWLGGEYLNFPHLAQLIEPELDPVLLADRAGELEDLLRTLFRGKQQITLGRLLWSRQQRVCLTVFSYGADSNLEERVVTCGLHDVIERERASYARYAPAGVRATTLTGSAETLRYAALSYALPEADLEQTVNLAACFASAAGRETRDVLKELLDVTLAAWEQRGQSVERERGLAELYRQRLGIELEQLPRAALEARAAELAREGLALGPAGIVWSPAGLTLRLRTGRMASYPDPIERICGRMAVDQPPVVCQITPGTLTAENILVDQQGKTWLTDFLDAGTAPRLWNLTSLEAVLRFALVDSTDLDTLHDLETRLATPARLAERLNALDLDETLRKIVPAIQDLRYAANEANGEDPALYQRGLLLHAAGLLAAFQPESHHPRQALGRWLHALLAAAMLCQQGSNPAPAGVEIDVASGSVRVEGRPVALSPQELAVLAFLERNSGRACSRREIVEQGLGEVYLEDKAGENRITTLMGRLREKIEPDRANPRYLITVKKQGYMLRPAGAGVESA